MAITNHERVGKALLARLAPEDVWQETLLHAWRDRAQCTWQGLPAFRRWLIFLVVAGPVTALIWAFLFPVIETGPILLGITTGDVVRFRPAWAIEGLPWAQNWLIFQAAFAVAVGAWAALFLPLPNDRRPAKESGA